MKFPTLHFLTYAIVWSSAFQATAQEKQISAADLTPDQISVLKQAAEIDNRVIELFNQNKFEEALEPAKQSVELRLKVLGERHLTSVGALSNLVAVYAALKLDAEAEPHLRTILRIHDRLLAPDDPTIISSMEQLALNLYGRRKYAEAKPLFQRHLKSLMAQDSENFQQIFAVTLVLGRSVLALREFELAESYFRDAVQRTTRVRGPDHPETAICLIDLSTVFSKTQQPLEAVQYLRQAHEIRSKANGDEHPKTVSVLNAIAVQLDAAGRYAEAAKCLQTVLKMRTRTLGETHPHTLLAMANLGTTLKELGEYDTALTYGQEALDGCIQHLGPDDLQTATCHGNLGTLHIHRNDFAAAQSHSKEALRIRRKVLGNSHPDTAGSLNNLATLHLEMGDPAAARPLFEESLAIKQQVFGDDHPETAIALSNLGMLLMNQGDYDAAAANFKLALAIRQRTLGPEHVDTALVLNNLGVVSRKYEDHVSAIEYSEQALAIYLKAFGEDHPSVLRTMSNLGASHTECGDLTSAETYLTRSLEGRTRTLGETHPSVGQTLSNLGALALKTSKLTDAAGLFSRSHKNLENALGESHPMTTGAIGNRILVAMLMGNPSKALALQDKARRAVATHVSKLLPVLSEKEQLTFLNNKYNSYLHVAVSLAVRQKQSPDAVRSSAEWVINGKAVGQRGLAQQSLMLRDSADPELAPMISKLQKTRARLARLALSSPEADEQKDRQQTIEELTSEVSVLSRELTRVGGEVSPESPSWIELGDVQRALPDDSVLIDIVRYHDFDFENAVSENRFGSARYAAWIIPPTGSNPQLIELGNADEIDELVKNVRSDIQHAATPDGALRTEGENASVEAFRKQILRLSERIWQPLENELKNVNKLVLSPDGALWLAPWSALPVSGESESYLIEQYNLMHAISGRDLVNPKSDRKTTAPIILANPLFDQEAKNKQASIKAIFKTEPILDETSTRGFSASSVLPKVAALPGTAIEALAIQPNVQKFTGQNVTLYKERYALEKVAKALQSPRVVSFATHGFFLPAQETELADVSAIIDDAPAANVDQSGKPIENPLLRCGLLLAGCNNRDASVAGDDGILTGMEIVGIDLRGTELVVLSACETGIGDVRNGEGVAGLRQAFQLAGAEAVVSTLWQVPDRDSALLTKSFFEELAGGATKAEALRTAQIQRIEKRRERYGAAHPFFWAAFTLTGR